MNKVLLLGRLTREPEVRYTTTTNTLVCSFTLAVTKRFVRQGEQRQADFINIIAWNKLGEFCSKYFKKGQQVSIVGRIQTRNYDDAEGKKRFVTEVIAEEAYFADAKRDGESYGGNYSGTPDIAPFESPSLEGTTPDFGEDFLQQTQDDLPF